MPSRPKLDPWQVEAMLEIASPDLNLSPSGRVLVQHVVSRGAGAHEIDYPTLMRLLRCSLDKLRATIREAMGAGLVTVVFHNGRGHAPVFAFVTERSAVDEGGEIQPSTDVGGNSPPTKVDEGGENPPTNAPTTTTTSTTTPVRVGAREDDPALHGLRTLLGEHAEVLVRLDAIAGTPTWPAALWGLYRPPNTTGPSDGGGTAWRVLMALPDHASRVAALAAACEDYVGKGKPFSSRYFRSFVEDMVREQRTTLQRLAEPPPQRSTRAPPHSRERKPADEQQYTPTPFQGFNR